MTCSRGDVVLVRWPDSDLAGATIRPALVIQADGLFTGLSHVVVAMITSNLVRRGLACRVTIPISSPEARGTGLRADSVVMADSLGTVHLREIHRVIGRLADMTPVDLALRAALGL